jgi:predicted phosphodiesterase
MPSKRMDTFRIAVIGDVHSNILALKASLKSIYDYEARVSCVDIIVFMGDLLSYGVHPNEVLSEVFELVSLRSTVLLLGNHDQLYLDLVANSSFDYYNKLPAWIKESVDLNLKRIDAKLLLSLSFLPYYSCSAALFSHANFFSVDSGPPDWRYVNTLDDHHQQLKILSQLGFSLGVLGHTHRSRCYTLDPSDFTSPSLLCVDRHINLNARICLSDYPCSILNAGSIGQPRESTPLSPTWLLLETDDSTVSAATYIPFAYDTNAHLKDISESGLSLHCIHKLLSFF